MFENDDWNADEDYLKEDQADEVIKNFHNEKMKSTFEFEVCTSAQNSNNNKDVTNADKTIKKGIIEQKNIKFNNFKQTVIFNDQKNRCRENLDLEIFHKNKNTEINSHLCYKAVNRSVLKTTEAINKCGINLKRKKSVAFFESTNDLSSTKKFCISTIKENLHHQYHNQQSLTVAQDMDIKNRNTPCNSKKQLLLDLLNLPNKKSIRNPRTKYTVIRKFPGPAGLLPDNLNESEMIDLDSIDKNKHNKINDFADVYSQNTKNIFTTGAWQLMMDDLPADFQLYEIADIKVNALAFSNSYKKVPFLAGVIQHIDYKPNNPHILLKDFSGKINACIHHSICKLYPNALGTNVVILVKDVGLIVTSKKYVCVIISAKNLVSIYSDNERLVETPYYEKLVDYDCNLNNRNKKITKLSEKKKTKHCPLFISNTNEVNDREEYIATNICDNDSASIERESYVDHVLDLDFNEDDSWLGVHINDCNLFGSDKFASSTPLYIENNNSENKSLSRRLHNFEQGKPKSMLITNPHRITIDNSLSNAYNTSNYNRLTEIPMLRKGNLNTKNKALSCDQNDTDDEILSQIDIDAIAENYDK